MPLKEAATNPHQGTPITAPLTAPGETPPDDLGAQPPVETLARIRSAAPALRGVARRIADTVLARPQWVMQATIAELAEAAAASPSSVVRACRELGFQGFPDLKLIVARDLARTESTEFQQHIPSTEPDDAPPATTLERVLRAGAQSLIDALATVDQQSFEHVVTAVARARRILFVAVGTSRTPATDAAQRLTTIGLHAFAPDDVWSQHVMAQQLSREDVCIAISRTGAMRPTLEGAHKAREGGAVTVALTSYSNTPLATMCDYALIAGAPELGFRLQGMTSQLALLAILDALYSAVATQIGSRAAVGFNAISAVTAQHNT
ncbi:MurR/RpiR family transcriptional regulator [Streptomyces sp. NPDC004752]